MIILKTTVPDRKTADRLSEALVGSSLCAGCSSYPIRSVYRWRGKIRNEREIVLEFKTTPSLEERLRSGIMEMHPYELPVVERLVVETDDKVEEWLVESTSRGGKVDI